MGLVSSIHCFIEDSAFSKSFQASTHFFIVLSWALAWFLTWSQSYLSWCSSCLTVSLPSSLLVLMTLALYLDTFLRRLSPSLNSLIILSSFSSLSREELLSPWELPYFCKSSLALLMYSTVSLKVSL